MESQIMVSIICNAYNHEKYIRSALESFVAQKADFKFEVLVHDDASTDKTADIIREFEEKYPDIIKPIYQTENQYSQKVKISWVYQYPRAQGKYWAFCEGDDYWTDPLKLQKQFDAMEAHPEIDICAHSAYIDLNGKNDGVQAPSDVDTIFSVEEVILGGGGFVATNSLFVRRDVWSQIPEYKKILSLDYVNQIQGSLRGGMLYLKDYMSAYRRFTDGCWTTRMMNDPKRYLAHLGKIMEMLEALDKETEYKYSQAINTVISDLKVSCLIIQGNYKEVLSKENRPAYKRLTRKEKIKVYIGKYAPWGVPVCKLLNQKIRNLLGR